jgi:chromosome segregation ATPase
MTQESKGAAGLEELMLDRLVVVTSQLAIAKDELCNWQLRGRGLHIEKEGLKRDKQSAEAHIKNLKAEVEECQATIRGLHNEAAAAKDTIETLKRINEELYGEKDGLRALIAEGQVQGTELEKKLATANALAGRLRETITNLGNRGEGYWLQAKRLRRLLKEARGKVIKPARRRS